MVANIKRTKLAVRKTAVKTYGGAADRGWIVIGRMDINEKRSFQIIGYSCDNVEANENPGAEWSTVEDKDGSELFLHLDLTARMWVMSGATILENFFLVDSSKWLRGFWKGSTLVISYKCGEKIRVFKLRFHPERGARESCTECVKLLETFFSINAADQEFLDDTASQERSETLLPVDPFVSQICSSILTGQTLPELYRKCNYEITNSQEDMETFVATCLSDPNFPAFVTEIEKALDRIMGE